MKKTKKKIALLILVIMLSSVIQISAIATEPETTPTLIPEVEAAEIFDDGKKHELNKDVTANGCYGAIYVENGTELIVKGGNIHGVRCDGKKCNDPECTFSMALWAYGKDTKVTIEDGYFTNDSDGSDHCDLIYVKAGAYIYIKGGTFKCATPAWTLNAKDNSPGQIIVSGGKFFEFNPADNIVSAQGNNDVVVADGHTVVKYFDSELNGYWYEVKKIVYENETFAELELKGNISASGCYAAIYANNSGLAIYGTNDNKVHGELCAGQSCGTATCGYATTVWANQNSNITITGGYYTNDADTVSNDRDHVDLIYAGNNSHITISGGTFKCATPQWTLNCKDGTSSTITVRGGRFYKFDPSSTNVGEGEIIVEEGYEVFKDGDWYEVVLAHQKNTIHEAKEPTYTEPGNIYYASCDVCGRYFTNKYAIEEITDKNSVIIPQLIEVGNNNDVNITDKAFDTAIKESNTIQSSTVVIPAVDSENTIESVTVPVTSLKEVASQNKELSIQTSEVTATIDVKALNKIVEQAGENKNIQIEIKKIEDKTLNEKQKTALKDKEVKTIISAEIIANKTTISNFGGGKVKIEIPFTLEKDTKGTDYKVVYIADDGKTTDVPSKYNDGYISVELEHFSEYAIVKVAKAENNSNPSTPSAGAPAPSAPAPTTTTPSNPKTGDGIAVYFVILAVAIVGICGIVIIKSKRK